MMRMGGVLLAGCLALRAAAAVGVEPPKFAAKPTAAKAGDKVKVEFAADRETDAAVYVLDAQGKCVRHLAAGVLGAKAPEPLKPGLAQSVEWDGQDDAGKPAAGAPFKVRVTLGIKPELDGFLMHNLAASGPVQALAVGPQGTLYVFHRDGTSNPNCGGVKIKLYNRDGKYLKALTPFPADIAPEKVKALGAFQTSEGDIVPRVHNYETLSFYPDSIGARGRDMPDLASSPAVDSKGRAYWMVRGPHICAVDADGGIPYESFLGPQLLPDIKNLGMAGPQWVSGWGKPTLAVSSDDKSVYFAGLGTGSDAQNLQPVPCVFRMDAEKRGPGEVFLGKLGQPGKEKDLLTAPRGLAAAKGFLYVADPGADRIAVFKEADRSYIGEIKVKNPQSIGVDPASGAVYVCAYTGRQTADLVKYSGYENPREVCRLQLHKTNDDRDPGIHRIAVDASTKPVLIWMPGWFVLGLGPKQLFCIEDAGDKFVDKGDPRSQELWAEGPRDLSVDRLRGELYIKANGQQYYRFDDKTGKLKDSINLGNIPNNFNSTELRAGTDGSLYTNTTAAPGTGLWRLDHEGKPLNWQGQNTHILPIGGIMCGQERHLALRPYAPVEEFFLVANVGEKLWPTALNALGQDGKTRRTVIWQCTHGAIPRLDPKGNIYLVDIIKPLDRSYPEFFDGKLPAPPKESGGGDLFWNSYMYASIIKFPPSGGAIWYAERKGPSATAVGAPPAELLAKPKEKVKAHTGYLPHSTAELQGALWYRFGFAPFSATTAGMVDHCMCEGCGFDVDDFGRVFYPNSGQFRVEVVDTNNNWIGAFGKYGNEDSGGPNARVKKPDIPLAWPNYVAVSDNYAYVADTVNRRTVRVKLGSAAEETCEVR